MKGLWLVIKLTELKEQWNIKFTINNSRKLKRILIRNSCIEAKEYVIVEWKKWLGIILVTNSKSKQPFGF